MFFNITPDQAKAALYAYSYGGNPFKAMLMPKINRVWVGSKPMGSKRPKLGEDSIGYDSLHCDRGCVVTGRCTGAC